MASFKPGDKVRVIKKYDSAMPGMKGIVFSRDHDDSHSYLIDFGPGFTQGHRGHGNVLAAETGHYVAYDHLELVSSAITQKENKNMIYHIAIEEEKMATNTTPTKRSILVAPECIECNDEREGILKIGAKHADAINKSTADRLIVTSRQFSNS